MQFPFYHIVTLSLLISITIIVYITKVQGTVFAIVAIGACLAYIVVNTARRKFTDPTIGNGTECLYGEAKQAAGILGSGCIDIWHLYHLIFWVLIGLLMPNAHLTILGLSVAWELTEHIAIIVVRGGCDSPFCGRVEDVFTNMIGYTIGSYLSSQRPKSRASASA
jgi:hypothetical protein